MSNELTGTVSHNLATAQHMYETLESSFDAKTSGKNALSKDDAQNLPVRIKQESATSADGRKVQLVLGESGQSSLKPGDAEQKSTLEKGHASLLIRSFSDNHQMQELDVTKTVNKTSLLERKVASVDGAKPTVRLKTGVDIDVITYKEAKALLLRDLKAFQLETVKPSTADQVLKNIGLYGDAGSYGEQRVSEDIVSLPMQEKLKLVLSDDIGLAIKTRDAIVNQLADNSGDSSAVQRDKAIYQAMGDEGVMLAREHLMATRNSDPKALSSLARNQAFIKDPFLGSIVNKAWAQDKAETLAQGKPIQSGQGMDSLKEAIDKNLAGRAGADRVRLVKQASENVAAVGIASAIINGQYTAMNSTYGNSDIAALHDPSVITTFQDDLKHFNNTEALASLKSSILEGTSLDPSSSLTRAIDQRILAIVGETARTLSPEGLKTLDRTLSETHKSLPQSLKDTVEDSGESAKTLEQVYNRLSKPDLSRQGSNAYQDDSFIAQAKPRYSKGAQKQSLGCPLNTALRDTDGQFLFHGNEVKMENGSYIATQAPTDDNAGNFFKAVFDKKSPVVVSLTHASDLAAGKVADYVPKPGQIKSFNHNSKTVSVLNRQTTDIMDGKFSISLLEKLDGNGQPTGQTTTHVHYNEWVDKSSSSPADMMTLSLLTKMLNPNPEAPVTVHCSAGIGRTGTFITVDDTVGASLAGKENTSVDERIKLGREQRGPLFVQKSGQYRNTLVCGDNAKTFVPKMCSMIGLASAAA